MAELGLVAGGARAELGGEFEVGFVTADGVECRVGVSDVWSVPFESCLPVRAFPSYKGQRHFVGRWWTATTGALVGYESWLERDRLILLDFDPGTVGIASQPFWLFWASAQEGVRSHAPDYFARLADGGAVVVDCRPAERIKPKDREAFAATAAACEVLGWRYEVVDVSPTSEFANVRWLSGYRHPRHALPNVVDGLRAVFTAPTPLMTGAQAVGDPMAVLPVLFHLLWRQELVVDLSRPLSPGSVVAPSSAVC